jgi:membrane protein required for colicin V production
MHGADLLIVAIVGISVIMGTVRGFIREVVALVAWVVAIWAAWRFSGFLHPYLGGLLVSTEQKAWVARAVMLVLVLLLGALVGAILTWMTSTAAGPSVMNRVLGFAFGFVRGAIVAAFLVLLGQNLHFEREPWWEHSKLMPYAEQVANWLRAVAGEARVYTRHALAADESHGGGT